LNVLGEFGFFAGLGIGGGGGVVESNRDARSLFWGKWDVCPGLGWNQQELPNSVLLCS